MGKTQNTKRKVTVKDSSKENAKNQKKKSRNSSKTIVVSSTSGMTSVTRKISAAALAKWKPLTHSSRKYCLQLMDYGIQMVMSRISDNMFKDVQSQLVSTRRSLSLKMEDRKGPVNKVKDYKNLSQTLIKLTEANKKLDEQLSILENAIKMEEILCTKMEEEFESMTTDPEETQLHPLLQQPFEKVDF
ncbi:uncharacterized protein LOC121369524 [Gigantopelta aegis]|uniref:uncharacterized protein LOC121369524 n=1 Tax=Gigantopelta aegis TaxID=1735272 RepID=UPI001B88AD0F|nr:uncharacterized protein LOC121369524 [Gigantopelta aegis]